MAFFVLENCCLRLLVSAGTKQSGGDGSPELPAAGSRRGGVNEPGERCEHKTARTETKLPTIGHIVTDDDP